MPRWVWFLPLAVAVAIGALQAFRLGWIAANMTETAAIEAYAALYVSEAGAGARLTDCVAFPGEDVWIVVRCGRAGHYRAYWVNRFGGLERQAGPGAWDSISPATKEPRT